MEVAGKAAAFVLDAHLAFLEPAAEALVALCDATGLRWGPNPRSLFWNRPPELHIAEFIIFHLIIWTLYRCSRGFYTSVVVKPRPTVNRESNVDLFIGLTFALCWFSQLIFKALRKQPLVQMCWMFMPCHLITLIWIYVCLSKGRSNYNFCVYLATLASVYHWGPVSAAVFPDWGDHKFWLEGPIFALHHGMLVAMPFYWALRYRLLPLSWGFVCHMTWVAMFVNCGFYTLISYLSGLNVNYMLYPPPKVALWGLLNTPYYRFNVIALLIVTSTALWIVFAAVNKIGGLVARRPLAAKAK